MTSKTTTWTDTSGITHSLTTVQDPGESTVDFENRHGRTLSEAQSVFPEA